MVDRLFIGFVRAFSVFQYLTLRSMVSAMTALLLSLIIGPIFIEKLSRQQIGQRVRLMVLSRILSKMGLLLWRWSYYSSDYNSNLILGFE